ncbi:septum formation initiator family protein [Fulvimarina sp. 2208YS6-2-32]|uniref:Septum formation initiator family protein n=1 Tax=Fulvimarina uroteuthidis TaxID=3098149 RepID=A0ABU5I7Y1_9HYPH|nr:septum formation initiator family protein [Fulvimarina sp. 2208YS6-2-32]MDY8110346.1 septum formation initiator family protein [Fulvimarina sp. 2208YS6-2-32]
MRTIQTKRSRLIRLIIPTISAAVLAYFAVHVQTGDYGLTSKAELERRLNVKRAELASVERERIALAQRVELLSPGTLERDMLDERARWALNFLTEDEIVILR